MVLSADGSYRGPDHECRAPGISVIDRGVVIKGQPGANAVYGVNAQCESKGDRWKERARIQVERWGSALTVTRTKTTAPKK
jgi:hypothetical protein